jgi:hypothetical protein
MMLNNKATLTSQRSLSAATHYCTTLPAAAVRINRHVNRSGSPAMMPAATSNTSTHALHCGMHLMVTATHTVTAPTGLHVYDRAELDQTRSRWPRLERDGR